MNTQKLLLFVFTLLWSLTKVHAQASWETFGQNRVQYRKFDWNYFDSTHFRAFYYDHGKTHAAYSINIAEQELSHIVYMMGGRLGKKLNIVIYNTFSDYRQTNIGRQNDEINQANSGKIDVVGDNIPIYFNGDHAHLKKQITKGIAMVIKNNMLFGDNVKDVVKNAVKMNLPEWYTAGYIDYIAEDWTPNHENEIQNLLQSKPKIKFADLAISNPKLIGHSFWVFLAKNYGENTISNLLYLTRYRKSVNNAIEVVLKKNPNEVFLQWQNFFLHEPQPLSKLDSLALTLHDSLSSIKIKPNTNYRQFTVSTSGNEVAYVIEKDGEYKVMIQDVKYNKSFEVLSGGVKANQDLADKLYPLISWSPSGNKVAIIYQKKNLLMLRVFTNGKRKMDNRVIPANRIDRITGMCFMSDENTLAITAIKKGQSDLYKLALKNARVEPITNDLFDDKNPVFVQNEFTTGILFLSNRTSNITSANPKSDNFNPHFNLYLYDPSKGTILNKLSDTKSEITDPMQWGMSKFAYLTQQNGKQVRVISEITKRQMESDTFSTSQSAPFPFTALSQDYSHKTAKVFEVQKRLNEYVFYLTPQNKQAQGDEAYQALKPVPEETVDTTTVNTNSAYSNYQTPYTEDTTSSLLDKLFQGKEGLKQRYQLFTGTSEKKKYKKYKSTFYPNFLQTSLDNTLLFTRYQSFDYSPGIFQNPPLSGFLTTSLTDVMEDYKITGGARLGVDFNSLDYFLQFNNYRKRTDWGVTYFHRKVNITYDQSDIPPPYYSPFPVLGKLGTDYLQGQWNYPFDMLKSIRLQLGIRYDRVRILATDKYSLGIPDDNQFWAVSRAEFVYDNTVSPIMNIWKGTRGKIFAEYQYKFNNVTKGFYNFGYDGRNYLGLYKNIILASRIAGAHSGGNAKILYLVGGVDNDLSPKQDPNTAIDFSQNYAFQSLATNMRGYRQGNRNGNSYLVINEEVRIPIVNTLTNKPVKSGFLRNLQLIGFIDIGSAWKGILPNSDNIANPIIINGNNGVIVALENSPYNFSMGYGTGLRTKLLGYFIRTDFAWNIEGIKKPMIHVSMATDF